MRALLHTACHCVREVPTTYPPPHTIVIPLQRFHTMANWHAPDAGDFTPMQSRTFELDEASQSEAELLWGSDHRFAIVHYYERLPT